MAEFLLTADVNLGIGRWLKGRGHAVTRVTDVEPRPADAAFEATSASSPILIAHDHRLAEGPHDGVTLLLVPQPSLDDIPRIAESIHQLVSSGGADGARCLRLGLRSGWARVA
jgi:hypothetical protein